MLMSLKKIFVEYNNRKILNNIDFNIDDNDKIALIGVNGTGKSTLLKIINDFKSLSESNCMVKNGLKIAYLHQDSDMFDGEDMLEYVTNNNEFDLFEAKKILNKLDLTDHSQLISSLSGGQKKRLALAKVLIAKSDLLLLDEPTNHLDANMIEWLENYLNSINCAIVMVSHDRYFLERIVNKIVELDNGNLYEYEGNYHKYLELKAQRIESEQATKRKQASLLKREYHWMMQGAKARSTKSKDRIERYEKLKSDLQSTSEATLEFNSMQSRLGKKILEINHLKIGYSNNILIDDLTYTFKNNERVGLVGINGSGKTSLLNVLAKKIKPLSGELEYGSTIKLGYFSQHSDDLNNSKRVIDYIKDKAEFIETNEGKISASNFLEKFLFDSEQQYSLIEKLSGGERRRLLLVGVLMKAPNFLILDEPTNDLDIMTLTILEDYLLNFKGIVVLVSHDRFFMDRVVDSLWIINNGTISFSNDDYTSYLLNNKSTTKKETNNKKEYVKEKKIRLSYQEQKELKTIDNEIENIEKELNEIGNQMMIESNDFNKLNCLSEKQKNLTCLLENKTNRWVELHEKLEMIENEK
ncbi:ATP-binding cassette subfamily F protein uup [Bacilli bacterium PM5-9]|nr:ATP-binding cassette subfamily F protein uup [Bacilli bacterium PM5-9]